MGALHSGHLSLVAESNNMCSCTVVSIYLNPAQFAPDEDLDIYPQNLDADLEALANFQVDAVFVPDNYKRVSMLAPGFLFEEINLGSHLPAEEYPPVMLMGGAALNHPGLISRGGKYTEGTLLVDGFFLNSTEPAVQQFALAYKAAYEKEPSIIERRRRRTTHSAA